ncbi:helix-turn-helix transcriptional regulator [Acidobacteria bacterium ACD]|nr:helix-turn-helix transcriptional regulator [Acidobacteria bacterium ACD]
MYSRVDNPPVARPVKAESERTRGDLLVAAARAFGEKGFEGARLAEIAAGAGIRRPSLLYHFPTKEALCGDTVMSAEAGLSCTVKVTWTLRAGRPGAAMLTVPVRVPAVSPCGLTATVNVAVPFAAMLPANAGKSIHG